MAETPAAQLASVQTELRLTREMMAEFRDGMREDLAEHRRRVHDQNEATAKILLSIQQDQNADRTRLTRIETETATNRRWIKTLTASIPLGTIVAAIFGYKVGQ